MKLSDWMASREITDEEMALRLGVHRATVSRLRRDTNLPSWAIIAKIKSVTEGAVGADDFLRESQ